MKKFAAVATQLAREFIIPLIGGLLWMWFGTKQEDRNWAGFIGHFSAGFFFVSFLTGSVFRVAKQVRTETHLSGISQRVENVVSLVERSARETIAWATGGDSYAYFLPSMANAGAPTALSTITVGTYPLFKVHARIVDLNGLAAMALPGAPVLPINHPVYGVNLTLGDLDPGHYYMGVGGVTLNSPDCRFNVFWQGRNGQWTQRLRYRQEEGNWHVAYRVTRVENDEEVVLEESIPANFPDPDTVNWG